MKFFGISYGSSLFAKVPVNRCPVCRFSVCKGLMHDLKDIGTLVQYFVFGQYIMKKRVLNSLYEGWDATVWGIRVGLICLFQSLSM